MDLYKTEFTAQEIFDHVVEHLLTQRQQSTCDDSCAYRGYNGLKCAAGALIPDEIYTPRMEMFSEDIFGIQFKGLLDRNTFLATRFRTHEALIMDLQSVHDDNDDPDQWPIALARVAADHNLVFNAT